MSRAVHVILIGATLLQLPTFVRAQDSQSRISIVHLGADPLRADLKYLLDQTSPEDQKIWEDIDAFLDTFLEGIDPARPFRIDFQTAERSFRSLWNIPVSNLKDFRNNIDLMGIVSKRQLRDTTLYKLEDYLDGWMRIKDGYAVLFEGQDEKIVSGLEDRLKAVQKLLKAGFNIGFEIENADTSAEAIERRKKEFAEIRDELVAAVKRKPTETGAEFDLKKVIVDRQLTELGRYLAELTLLRGGGSLDKLKHIGRLTGHVKGIEGSSLDKGIQLLAQAPSRFSNVKTSERSIGSGRINFVFDQIEKDHLQALLKLVGPAADARIDADKELNPDQKVALKNVVGMSVDALSAGTRHGTLDAFVEVTRTDSGLHGLVAGIVLPDGVGMANIVRRLADVRDDITVTMDTEGEGDVAIHRVEYETDHIDKLKDFFGEDLDVWVGISETTALVAVGDESLGMLKSTIQEIEKPNSGVAENPFLAVDISIGPWIGLLDRFRSTPLDELRKKIKASGQTKKELKKLKEELNEEEESAERRKTAIDTFSASAGKISVRASRVQNRLELSIEVNQPVLRFIGQLIAKVGEQLSVEE